MPPALLSCFVAGVVLWLSAPQRCHVCVFAQTSPNSNTEKHGHRVAHSTCTCKCLHDERECSAVQGGQGGGEEEIVGQPQRRGFLKYAIMHCACWNMPPRLVHEERCPERNEAQAQVNISQGDCGCLQRHNPCSPSSPTPFLHVHEVVEFPQEAAPTVGGVPSQPCVPDTRVMRAIKGVKE